MDRSQGTFIKFEWVEFSLGYQRHRSQVTRRCMGIRRISTVKRAYSNGLYLSIAEYPFKRRGYYAIYLGHVKSTRLPYTRLVLATWSRTPRQLVRVLLTQTTGPCESGGGRSCRLTHSAFLPEVAHHNTAVARALATRAQGVGFCARVSAGMRGHQSYHGPSQEIAGSEVLR